MSLNDFPRFPGNRMGLAAPERPRIPHVPHNSLHKKVYLQRKKTKDIIREI